MRVFVVPQVARWMRKERLPEAALCQAAREVAAGRLGAGEADLGELLFKKRIARPGGGKRGGYRAILACRRPGTRRVLFAYAWAKNAAATLTPDGQAALARVAAAFLDAADAEVAALLAGNDVMELNCHADQPH